MARYLFIYRGGNEFENSMSADEAQAYMQQWMDWIGSGFQGGWIADAGDALKPEGKVVHADRTITDGPFAESKELVGGFSIVQADSLSAASQLATSCPIFQAGGKVEVRELAEAAPKP